LTCIGIESGKKEEGSKGNQDLKMDLKIEKQDKVSGMRLFVGGQATDRVG